MIRASISSFFMLLIVLFLPLSCGTQKLSVPIDVEFDFLLELDTASISGVMASPDRITLLDKNQNERTYWGIFQHAPGKITYKDVFVGENATLQFVFGILTGAWDKPGDGIRFEISANTPDSATQVLFSKYIDAKKNPEDRLWQEQKVSLTAIKNITSTITFCAYPGLDETTKDNHSDWGFWGQPVLTSSGRNVDHHHSPNPNILLITLDTCRADYLGCYGNTWNQTPYLDRLAKEGVLFENMYAASSTTSPSHVSILTSLQPNQHGVINNGYKLADAVPRLPQWFIEDGYKTGAALSVHHLINEYSGLGKWFDNYNHLALKWMSIDKGMSHVTRGAFSTTSAAIDWLENVHNDPFFLWVHYYDPHAPYLAEGEYHKKFYRGDPQSEEHHNMESIHIQKAKSQDFKDWVASFRDVDYFRKEYGAEIAYVDSQIGRLLSSLKRLKINENTLIVITGDHGENLGDHEIYFDHWTLFNTDIHVPMIFWFPKQLPQGVRISTPVTHIDIAPTILDVIGEGKNIESNTIFDGISLKPLWENKSWDENRILTSDGLLYTGIAGFNKKYKVVWELRDAPYHEKLNLSMDRVWIFDRLADPDEISPIGCFYWGDPVERQTFKQDLRDEVLAIVDEDMDIKETKQLQIKLQRIKDRACQMEVPSVEELKGYFADGKEGAFLKPDLENDSQFFGEIIAILGEMKKGVCPPSLDTRLKDVIDQAVLSGGTIHSQPVSDENMKEILNSLGYR